MKTGGLGFFAFQIDQGVAWSWSWSLAYCVYEYVYHLSGSPAVHFIPLFLVEDAILSLVKVACSNGSL